MLAWAECCTNLPLLLFFVLATAHALQDKPTPPDVRQKASSPCRRSGRRTWSAG
jgi:hypothetical protein